MVCRWWVMIMNCVLSRYLRTRVRKRLMLMVVERGLDLIEDVERARPCQEQGEQEGDGGHGLLSPGEQAETTGGLVGELDLQGDPSGLFAPLFVLALKVRTVAVAAGLGSVSLRVPFAPGNTAAITPEKCSFVASKTS